VRPKGLREMGFEAFSECNASLCGIDPRSINQSFWRSQDSLQIHAFGWPVGVILDNDPDFKPYPTNDGIRAEVSVPSGPLNIRCTTIGLGGETVIFLYFNRFSRMIPILDAKSG